jgi:hypothetical protein
MERTDRIVALYFLVIGESFPTPGAPVDVN